MALFSKGPSSLTLCGTLAKLSAEIRLEIWQYFMPREDDHVYPEGNLWEQYQDSPSNALAILRTNRFIYEEISYELYRNRTFGFIIDPSKDRWSPLGTRTKPGKLRHTDFRLFKKLRLDVMAPNLEDRGQVHQLRDSAIDLVCVLSGHKASLECRSRAYSTFEQQQMLHGFVYTLAKCMVSRVPRTLVMLSHVLLRRVTYEIPGAVGKNDIRSCRKFFSWNPPSS